MKKNLTSELSPQWLQQNVQQMKIAREEQESHKSYDPIDKVWTVFSSVPRHIKDYLKNLDVQKGNLKVMTAYKGKPTSIEFKVQDDLFNNKIFKKKRVISVAHKKALQDGRNKI